ncbi:restriction endonuclease subunit S [Xanthomonas axonopodis]|uniref:restriction endonuclease subunit S n=1 Tax=Xanthomonas axonopodis TaxID=53413 RepID=UPI0020C9AAFF|nr:restriction endonuclease subunit S [Xanthomonas axonopodis]
MSYFAASDQLPAWVGKPPKGWKTDWLKWHVSLSTERPDEEEQSRLPYLSNEDIASWTGKLLREELEPSDADSRLFHSGDVLFNKLRPYLAKVFSANFDGVSSGELLCLRPSERVVTRYLFYVLTSFGFIDAVDSQTFGSKMPRADWETVGHQPLPLPRIEIQQRIAGFLDEKTARIDALIEKKQALLERLAEKRQALITSAVTKGLNPDVPMKPSGLNWSDQIPSSWQSGNIRRFASMKTGHTPSRSVPEYWEDCTIPWFTLADVWQIRDGTRWYLESTSEKINELGLANSAADLLPAGTVILSRTASVGFSGIMPVPMATSQDFWNWICGPKLLPEYLLLLFRSMIEEFELSTNGSTHKTIYQGIAAGFRVCVPGIEEQRQITTFVLENLEKMDAVRQKVTSSVDALQSYRSAVITAAVTGQLSGVFMDSLTGSDS